MGSYFHQTYAADDVIPDTDAALARYTQSSTISRTEDLEALITKSLTCREVYNEYDLKGILIEGIHNTGLSSMRSYFSTDPEQPCTTLLVTERLCERL